MSPAAPTDHPQLLALLPTWQDSAGNALSCHEKIKVLNQNLAELLDMAQDALEDAVLMGADEAQVRACLHALVDALENPYDS